MDKFLTIKAIIKTLIQNPFAITRVLQGDSLKNYVDQEYPEFSNGLPVI